jgi:hypothetical protein
MEMENHLLAEALTPINPKQTDIQSAVSEPEKVL